MSHIIRLRSEVVDDLAQAADWYRRQRPELDKEFLDAAYAGIDVIAARPASFPVVHKDVQRALLKRFPYAIYFRTDREAVIILVVVHTARSPRVWRKRTR